MRFLGTFDNLLRSFIREEVIKSLQKLIQVFSNDEHILRMISDHCTYNMPNQ